MRVTLSTLVLLITLIGGCGNDGTISDSEGLRAALGTAAPGDRVCLSAGTFTGPFDVPAGVTLCGAGIGETQIVGPSDLPALRLMPGSATNTTAIELLTVEGHGDFAVIARGAGDVTVRNAEITVPLNGAGLGVESLTHLTMDTVDIHGPVTAANANGMPLEPSITDSATYGVVCVTVMAVEARDVEVAGFAYVGVLAVNSPLSWDGGSVSENLGTGMLIYGGSATITNASLTAALQGTRLIPAYNMVIAGGADVSTNGLEVSRGGGYGILQSEATATHSGLMAADNANAALWVQNSGGFTLQDTTVQNNGMAGVVALSSTEVSLSQVTIQNTRAMTRIFGTMPVQVGDGVHLLRSTTNVDLDTVTLNENARVGVLFDLDGSDFSAINVTSVDVSGSAMQLGAIAQNGTIPADWDMNITRNTIVQMNDAAFSGSLDTVGIVGPSDMPAVTDVLAIGLVSIVGPSD